MGRVNALCVGLFAAAAASSLLCASAKAETPAPAVAGAKGVVQDVLVTARRREEALRNVPISVTALSGDDLRDQQFNSVKDLAQYAPSLNITSDSTSRAFVSIRGIGITLAEEIQPGVGIFIDGIYQINTSYLTSPLVDVERVEVLRGPQGTLFGNNTLGGAINVITRQPSNTWRVKLDGAYAWQDDFGSASASISGPIVKDLLQFRLGGAYHHQDGFQNNTLLGGKLNPLTQKSVNGALRLTPAEWATFTVNGNYDYVDGGYFPYLHVNSPHEYRYDGPLNVNPRGKYKYYGVNGKGEFRIDSLKTDVTVVAGYNRRDGWVHNDVDLSPVDFLQSNDHNTLDIHSEEIRFDTKWADNVSTLFGLYESHATTHAFANTLVVPANVVASTETRTANDNKAVFGTLFWTMGAGFDFSAGLRYDHQALTSTSAYTAAAYTANELQPRFTLTRHWTPDVMTYVSAARGVRGGGQNPPGGPTLIYHNDSVWTYELGTKVRTLGGRLSVDADVFYNDYKNYLGLNAIVPSSITGLPIVVNLNTGTVHSYGVEFEGEYHVTPNWRFTGNFTVIHARVVDQSGFQVVAGFPLGSDHVLFTPDWSYNIGTTYTVPVGQDSIELNANVAGRGPQVGLTYGTTQSGQMASYYLANGSIAYRHGNIEAAVFATNLFDRKYLVNYIDASLLVATGLPPFAVNSSEVTGDRRRVGVRFSYRY